MTRRAVLPIGIVLATIEGRRPADAVELLRALCEAAIPDPVVPSPLFQPGLRWIGEEWQIFRCERLRVTMPIRDCLDWRGSAWPSGRRKGRPKHLECQGCPVGDAHAARLCGYVLEAPSQPPEVLPWSQRMAKRARALVDHDPGHDPLAIASGMTPDDGSDWRA